MRSGSLETEGLSTTRPDDGGVPAGPVRRTYAAGSGLRDRDALEGVIRLRVLGWSIVGAFLGFLLGVFLSVTRDVSGWVILLTTLVGWAMSYVGPLLILEMAGRAGATLYAPSGRSTPRKKEYSLAESLVVRGLYDEAAAAFQEAIDDDPQDWEPYLRIARMKRDRTSDAEGAANWFKRALSQDLMPSGVRLLVLKEYVELCGGRLGEPERAAPVLARIADEEEGSALGRWSAGALSDIRRTISEPGEAP